MMTFTSIILPNQLNINVMYKPLTQEEWMAKVSTKLREITSRGFKPDWKLTTSAACPVYRKGNEIWIFSMDGEYEYTTTNELLGLTITL